MGSAATKETEPADLSFHGEPVGIPLDVLKIAISEVANLSERRLYRLTTGSLSQRLPPGLASKDRPQMGMMVPQTTAAALVSENKALGWPASMDSIPTCEDQEDHWQEDCEKALGRERFRGFLNEVWFNFQTTPSQEFANGQKSCYAAQMKSTLGGSGTSIGLFFMAWT